MYCTNGLCVHVWVKHLITVLWLKEVIICQTYDEKSPTIHKQELAFFSRNYSLDGRVLLVCPILPDKVTMLDHCQIMHIYAKMMATDYVLWQAAAMADVANLQLYSMNQDWLYVINYLIKTYLVANFHERFCLEKVFTEVERQRATAQMALRWNLLDK